MSNKRTYLGFVSVVVVIVAGVAIVIGYASLRPHKSVGSSFAVMESVSSPSTTASVMDLCYMTEVFVDLEGGTYGGLLKDSPIEVTQKMFPKIGRSELASRRILWLYSYVPVDVLKESTVFGDGWLKISAKKSPNDSVTLALVPKDFGSGIRHIRLVNTEDQ